MTQLTEEQQRGLVIMSALINFIDWLSTQGVLVTNVPEPRAAKLRGELVKGFLTAHSEGENYFMQADDIAARLGAPFAGEEYAIERAAAMDREGVTEEDIAETRSPTCYPDNR